MDRFYKIHNKANKADLVYPSIGLWHSNDLQEAREVQQALREYLKLRGLQFMSDGIVIKDMDTGEEIL